ncbi:hypothetical protein F1880_003908 [Penicillium rolfsii]|nr:hypothetical protein F1880_003908 [Penicillium rolfsii]
MTNIISLDILSTFKSLFIQGVGKMVKTDGQFADSAAPSDGCTGDARESITCALCPKDLPPANYSSSAKKRVTSDITRKGMDALKDQQVVRCDSCGIQSRSAIHCMSCNQVWSTNEFANTQHQLSRPFIDTYGDTGQTGLPCEDILQLNERGKVAKKQDDEITELPRGLGDLNLGCQGSLQVSECVKVVEKQDELVNELPRAFNSLAPRRMTEKSSESTPAINHAIGMAENEMRQESARGESNDTFVPAKGRFGMRAESWTGGASSASAIRASAQSQGIIGDMFFDTLFGYDDDVVYSSSYQG